MYTGPHLIKDNLVFGYDTGYGVADNNTATRFYPGENTSNLFSSPNFTNHTDTTVGTTSIVKEDFGDGKIGIRMIQEGTSDIASFSMGSYSAPSSAGTYTWSSFIHSTSTGGKVKAQVTVYVNGTRHWLTNSNTWTTSVTECSHLFIATIANQWHRIENQFTLPTGTLTNLQLGSFYRTTSNFTIKLANAQFELKQHTTPFVDGTRSDTASIIDLKKTTDIDVSNISFDSTGQPTFDGSDDCIDLGDSLNSIGSAATFEMVFKATETNDTYRIMLGWGYGNSNYSGIHIGSWTSGYTDESFHVTFNASALTMLVRKGHTFYKDNKYHHAVVTAGVNNYSIWIDGVEQTFTLQYGTQSTVFSNIVGYNSNIVSHIGKRPYGGGSGYFKGEIPVMKVYDRILSDGEIKQNYNAYKNRFDI